MDVCSASFLLSLHTFHLYSKLFGTAGNVAIIYIIQQQQKEDIFGVRTNEWEIAKFLPVFHVYSSINTHYLFVPCITLTSFSISQIFSLLSRFLGFKLNDILVFLSSSFFLIALILIIRKDDA